MIASEQRMSGLLLLAAGVAYASDGGQIGVLPYTAPSPEVGAFVRDVGRRRPVVELTPSDLAARLKALNGVVITGRKGFWRDWLVPLERFVERGGCLVLMGRAGRFVDTDRNGQYDSKVDVLPIAELDRLAGARPALVGLRASRLRVFEDNAFFWGFDVGRWIRYPRPQNGRCSLARLSVADAKAVAGVWLTHGFQPSGPGVPAAPYYGARFSGEAPYLTLVKRGKGLVLRVADDLLARRRGAAMLDALLMNLVSENCRHRATANVAGYGTVQPRYHDGNLLDNGNTEELLLVEEPPPRDDNRINERPYLMAVGWAYNAYHGFFHGFARKRESAGHCLFMASVPGSDRQNLGGVCFYQQRHMNWLKNGKRYALGLSVKEEGVNRAQAQVVYHLANGQRAAKSLPLELNVPVSGS